MTLFTRLSTRELRDMHPVINTYAMRNSLTCKRLDKISRAFDWHLWRRARRVVGAQWFFGPFLPLLSPVSGDFPSLRNEFCFPFAAWLMRLEAWILPNWV